MSFFPQNSLYNKQFAQQAAFLNHLQETSNIEPGETVIYTNYPTEVVTDNRHDAPPPKKGSTYKETDKTNYAPTYSGATYGAAAGGAVGPGGVYQSVSTYPGKSSCTFESTKTKLVTYKKTN